MPKRQCQAVDDIFHLAFDIEKSHQMGYQEVNQISIPEPEDENKPPSHSMDKNESLTTDVTLTEVVIPKENAVFWMDGQGRWQNRHGRFEHRRIIDHFNRSIRRDNDGYYVTQVRGVVHEKVYFPFEDTPLFVMKIIPKDPMRLVLNTGETIPLDPMGLFVRSDQLYQRRRDEHIKFTSRALLAMAPFLEETAEGLAVRASDRSFPIPER